MTGPSIDEILPNEMFFKIFSFLDLTAFRNVRRVSKKWKRLVVAGHPRIHIVVPITDKTLSKIKKLTETQVSLYIHHLTRKGKSKNEVVSATTGTGLLFAQAERIQFKGDKISPAEIQKRLPYAIDTVRELSFVHLGNDITVRPFLNMNATFSALRELEIDTNDESCWDHPSGFQGMFECYTSILQRLATLDSGPQMPLLESLKLSFNPRSLSFGKCHRFTDDMFVNFLAIAKLIRKCGRTLKEIEIDFTGASDVKRNPAALLGLRPLKMSQAQQQTEMKECIDAFSELVNLNRIRCRAVNIRDKPWDWELQLLQRPRNLKELRLLRPRTDGFEFYVFPDMVTLLFPEKKQMLTTVKIEAHRPHDHVDLAVFEQSPNLKTLWMEFYVLHVFRSKKPLLFTNVDKLPRQLTSIHLKSNRINDRRHQHVILTREQIRWIVDNLQNLKSFWTQLVLDNQNGGGDANDNNVRQPQEHEEWEDVDREDVVEVASSPSNIDVQLFRDIIKMPKTKDLKFDMMKASNLAKRVSIEEIREYSEMYTKVPRITTTCRTYHNINHDQPVPYTELSIQIN